MNNGSIKLRRNLRYAAVLESTRSFSAKSFLTSSNLDTRLSRFLRQIIDEVNQESAASDVEASLSILIELWAAVVPTKSSESVVKIRLADEVSGDKEAAVNQLRKQSKRLAVEGEKIWQKLGRKRSF